MSDTRGAPGDALDWVLRRERGSAAELHLRDIGWRRALWLLSVDGPSLVLGSTQADDVVDHAATEARGVRIARRRSGGGAVWLDEDSIWIDVTIGRGDPLWSDDVSRSGLWLGEAFVAVLESLGHEGAKALGPNELVRNDRGTDDSAPRGRAVVCFAGVSAGEVVDRDGRKLVGISQRRTRDGARFQCVTYRRWDPAPMAACLRDPSAALAVDDRVVGTVPMDGESLLTALHRNLVALSRFSPIDLRLGGE